MNLVKEKQGGRDQYQSTTGEAEGSNLRPLVYMASAPQRPRRYLQCRRETCRQGL